MKPITKEGGEVIKNKLEKESERDRAAVMRRRGRGGYVCVCDGKGEGGTISRYREQQQ